MTTKQQAPEFTFHGAGGHRVISTLRLYWEAEGDSFCDDYTPHRLSADYMSADDLLRMWAERYAPDGGDVRISWYVEGSSVFETAPFQVASYAAHHFLDFYTWPVNVRTGERVNWLSLPVVDKWWKPSSFTKGGFIQQVTGWKPSALVPTVNAGLLLGGARS